MTTPDVHDATQAAHITVASEAVVRARIAVRWRDLDAFNHVNNSNFLTYLEEARLQWLKDVPGSGSTIAARRCWRRAN